MSRSIGACSNAHFRSCRAILRNRMAFGIIATVLMVANAKAQEAEPRSYSNTPVGLNFLIAGNIYSDGKIAFNPALAIADAKFHADTWALAYVRSFDVGGQSAKFDVIVPYSGFSARGLVAGQPRERSWPVQV